MNETLVWLRDDLRMADNPALNAAAERGNPVTLLYVLDEVSTGVRPLGAASKWWLHHSLQSLSSDLKKLGLNIVFRRGSALAVVPEVVRELGADAVYWNRRYGLAERDIDTQLKTELREQSIEVQSFRAGLLIEPWTISTGAGKPYTVFTPYYKATLQRPEPRAPFPVPLGLSRSTITPPSDDIDRWSLLPTSPDWAGGLRDHWQPGEAGAIAQLNEFIEERVEEYAAGRDFPALHKTSELAPHLRFGEISPFQVWHEANSAAVANPEIRQGVQSFLRELAWREFSYNLLFHWPDLSTQNFNRKFDTFPWWNKANSPEFEAWKHGKTGIPLVDAGMRELWHTGTMHNRVRMVVASFLTKNLRIDWRLGEQWFWDTLVDADPANNPASWQWVAGCGADAAPYFRVFNPELQAKKFDPDGEYIRRWVPEAVEPDGSFAQHDSYKPIVDLKLSRDQALTAYDAIK